MRRLALLLAALCGGGADLDAPMPMLKVTLHHGAADRRYAATTPMNRWPVSSSAPTATTRTPRAASRGLTRLAGTRATRLPAN